MPSPKETLVRGGGSIGSAGASVDGQVGAGVRVTGRGKVGAEGGRQGGAGVRVTGRGWVGAEGAGL